MGNLKYHTKIIHLNMGKKAQYKCSHGFCKIDFKTQRQKALHHEKTEVECKDEHVALIQLIKKAKKAFSAISRKYGKPKKSGRHLEITKALKKHYIELSSIFLETGRENFSSMMNNNKEEMLKSKKTSRAPKVAPMKHVFFSSQSPREENKPSSELINKPSISLSGLSNSGTFQSCFSVTNQVFQPVVGKDESQQKLKLGLGAAHKKPKTTKIIKIIDCNEVY